ncbi:MAG: putative oxygen-independent coproporphyrinogen III oxidase [Planctomycetota bacterium]
MFSSNPPLGLYIHLPWCEKKCPYCDFNSHEIGEIPEQQYIDALLIDLQQDLPLIWGRSIETIFIGGGTPSLFSAASIDSLFSGLRALLNFSPGIEITMESNPGSAETERYKAYREAGVNRLSIGIQSLNDHHLTLLGRIHDSAQAVQAFDKARMAGFDNINLDLMYGLPEQSLEQAGEDLSRALALQPEHLSHYQLTIEPNTLFHSRTPAHMPDEDLAWQQQLHCQDLLFAAGYQQYEISAYSRPGRRAEHNLNYWHFGDYLGIGAGAHGKITLGGENRVLRRVRQRQPKAYMADVGVSSNISESVLDESDLIFEFMLNALRLSDGFESRLFHDNTGLALNQLNPALSQAVDKGLLDFNNQKITPTELGIRFLNDLQSMFLDVPKHPKKPFWSSDGGIMHSHK